MMDRNAGPGGVLADDDALPAIVRALTALGTILEECPWDTVGADGYITEESRTLKGAREDFVDAVGHLRKLIASRGVS